MNLRKLSKRIKDDSNNEIDYSVLMEDIESLMNAFVAVLNKHPLLRRPYRNEAHQRIKEDLDMSARGFMGAWQNCNLALEGKL